MGKRARASAAACATADATPPRVRGVSGRGDGDVKRRRRMEKNRNSAQLSRMRRKAYVENLEHKVESLTDQIESMEARMDELKEENLALKDMLREAGDEPRAAGPRTPTPPTRGAVLPPCAALVEAHALVSQPVEAPSPSDDEAAEARRATKYNLRRTPRKSAAYADCITPTTTPRETEEEERHKRAMEESIRKSYEILRHSMPRRHAAAGGGEERDVAESDEDAVFPAVDVGLGVGVDAAFRAGADAGQLEDVLGGTLRTPRTPAAFDFFNAPAALSMFDDGYYSGEHAPLFL